MRDVALLVLIGFFVGAVCGWFRLPVPAPPSLIGVCGILSITIGYMSAVRLLEYLGK